jgi:hypothetical protein
MDIFEYQIKQQLIEITENGLLKKIDEHMDLTYDETVKFINGIHSIFTQNFSLKEVHDLHSIPY